MAEEGWKVSHCALSSLDGVRFLAKTLGECGLLKAP